MPFKGFVIAFFAPVLFFQNGYGGLVFQSATLGQTAIHHEQVRSQEVLGTHVSYEVFGGARFQVFDSWKVDRIGGHFVGADADGSFFGAIVQLSGSSDFPDSDDLSTTDVLATTRLTFPNPSNEVFANISLSLQPGWYAVVFGSGLFGATGDGAAVFNGQDIGSPSYIGWQPGSTRWRDLPEFFDNHRYVVEGSVVPEPSVTPILSAAVSLLPSARRARMIR